MIWILLIAAVYIAETIFVIGVLNRRVKGGSEVLEYNVKVREEEQRTKRGMLEELADLTLGFVPAGDIETIQQELTTLEESLRSQRGRLTITEAELEAVETRQRELEEIERELESSSIEAGRELEMLRAQEREFQERNDALGTEVEKTGFSIELLLTQMASNPEFVKRLANAKAELEEAQKRIQWFTAESAQVNHKYMELKRAYDALDIEYAQLYEKQNALMQQT